MPMRGASPREARHDTRRPSSSAGWRRYLDEYEGPTTFAPFSPRCHPCGNPEDQAGRRTSRPIEEPANVVPFPPGGPYGLVAVAVVSLPSSSVPPTRRPSRPPRSHANATLPTCDAWGLAVRSGSPSRHLFLHRQLKCQCPLGLPVHQHSRCREVGRASDGLIYRHLGERSEVALSFWSPGDIYVDGCRWETTEPSMWEAEPHRHQRRRADCSRADHPLLNQREVCPRPTSS